MTSTGERLLTINTGSSSLKAALYQADNPDRRDVSAQVDRIGLSGGRMHVMDADGATLSNDPVDVHDHGSALAALLGWLRDHDYTPHLAAVGHRIVHGGPDYGEPCLITPDVIAALHSLMSLDPDHLPQALDAIAAVTRAFPTLPQVACFDTAFHRHMPHVARIYALPRDLTAAGVVRYGFHGLSYEYIMREMHRIDTVAVQGKIVIAHLGSGASMAAVRNGKGLDTTMGLTPTGGLVMGTRTGDLDPGVLLYLLQTRHMSVEDLNILVNRKSGLLGVSGIGADMRDLLARQDDDSSAAEAVALFCYQAQKFLGALTAALGGLDTLIFTGGIGQHAAPVRERICTGLEFLGLQLDSARNAAHAPIISADGAPVTVRVMETDEDAMIAYHTHNLLRQGA